MHCIPFSSSSNIFLPSNIFDGKEITLTINITRLEANDNPVLLKFSVFTNNQNPLILQRNYLNYGFTTSASKYQYQFYQLY